ncbi:MAG: hypothetical protein ACTHMZ_01135 [Actinomycetes bacterium]
MSLLLPSLSLHPFPVATARDVPSTGYQDRSTAMHQLLHEDLARANMQSRLREAERSRQARRLLVAKRAVRRAETASARARRALSAASMY